MTAHYRSLFRILCSRFAFMFGVLFTFTFVVRGSAFAEVTKVTITTRATIRATTPTSFGCFRLIDRVGRRTTRDRSIRIKDFAAIDPNFYTDNSKGR